jgi:two-component system phosphate regulon sensor histidine kinase PhoR
VTKERHAVVVTGVRRVTAAALYVAAFLRHGARLAREAEERASLRERELRSIEAISNALAGARDADAVARALLDEIASLLSVEFAGLVLVDDELKEAHGLLARKEGQDFDYWRGLRFDLRHEPSGVASAAFDAAPVTVYDTRTSPLVNKRVAQAVGAQSAAFVPLVSGERVIAVLVIATTRSRRAFSADELGPLRTLAAEAALALERARSSSQLEEALEREQLVSSIARKVRSELDLDTLLRVAVGELRRALGLSRCFVRLGADGGQPSLEAESTAEGFTPVPPGAVEGLPVVNAALKGGKTVAVADAGLELDGEGRDLVLELGSRSVLAVPIVVDRPIGVLALHRSEAGAWSQAERGLAEAVAREVGLGIRTARLLRANELRLIQQEALLKAAQVVTGELDVETVLQLLVDQVTELLQVDAADCYLVEGDGTMLGCAAVRGLDPSLVGFAFPARKGIAAPILADGAPVVEQRYDGTGAPVPHPAYEGFTAAIAAPMSWAGETRGVLGAGTRDPARVFEDHDLEALASFATLAGLALGNAETFQQGERQAAMERSFSRIASLLGEPVSLTATLDAVARAAAEAYAADSAAVLASELQGYRLAGSHALPDSLRTLFADGFPDGADALEHASKEGRPIISSELADDERFSDSFRASADSASLIAIPIAAPRSDRHALAIVFFRDRRTFADADLDLAGQLAARSKEALERSELFEVERRSRLLAQQLAETGSLFSGELEPGAVLDEVVEQAPVLLRADGSSIRVVEGDELVTATAIGPGSRDAQGSRVRTDTRPAGRVVELGTSVAIEDVRDDPALLEGEPMLVHGYAAYLGVPLFGAEGDLQGVLAVFAARPRVWQEEEIEALRGLAANASVAYSKAELYQQVELERERSVAILANVADGIVAVDRDERIVLWNAAAERITRVPSEEAVGRPVFDVLQRELRSESEAGSGDRLVPVRRGDREIWLSVTEAVMRDPAGETAGRIFAFRDISGERVVEQMRSDFVSTVSHELRAPLTSIYGFAATLLREDVEFGEAERRTFLGYIESEAARLTTIVDKLLSVARLDAGDLQLELAPVDVRSVVSQVVESARSDREAVDGHEVVVELPESPLAARTDPEKLRQVLANLVDNAIRFSPNGGRVTVGAARRGETIVLTVADQGVGIPDTEQERIFAKFYRVGDAQTGGTGVGLFIAQGLVSALGGRITVRSEEGRGSNFVVELPSREGDEGAA